LACLPTATCCVTTWTVPFPANPLSLPAALPISRLRGRRPATILRRPMQDPVHKTVLGNGLRVVTVELPHLHAGMLAAYVRAGSRDRKSTRLNSSHLGISYAVFCLKKKTQRNYVT